MKCVAEPFAKAKTLLTGESLMSAWIDTHTHLQATVFDHDLESLVAQARVVGVIDMIICAGSAADWARCAQIAQSLDLSYTLGIHPLFTPEAQEADLALLEERVEQALSDKHFVGIGEIGIDSFVGTLDDEKQEHFFAEQLKIARRYALPLSVHIRRSGSRLLKYLNRYGAVGGVIHAFNGSQDEFDRFAQLGFRFGFGGASTYVGSQRIRRHLAGALETQWVLETDAPDIPSSRRRDEGNLRTEPADIVETGELAATLRGITVEEASRQSLRNAFLAFPRLALRHPELSSTLG